MGRTEIVVRHWGGVGLPVEVECANVPRHEGGWNDRDRFVNIGVCDGLGNRNGEEVRGLVRRHTGWHVSDDRARARERQRDARGGVLRRRDVSTFTGTKEGSPSWSAWRITGEVVVVTPSGAGMVERSDARWRRWWAWCIIIPKEATVPAIAMERARRCAKRLGHDQK